MRGRDYYDEDEWSGRDGGGGRRGWRGRGGRGGRGRGRGRGHDEELDTSVTLSNELSYRQSYGEVSPAVFVRAIAEESHVDEVVLRLAAEANLKRIDDVLLSPCQVAGQRTFERVFLRFVEFLVSPQFKRSPHSSVKKTLYRRVVDKELFLTRLVNCFEKERDALEQLNLLSRGVSACVELMYQVCTKLPTLVTDDPFVYEKAHDLHTWIVSNDVVGISPQTLQLLSETLDICEAFLPTDIVRPRHGVDPQASAVPDRFLVQPQPVHRVSPTAVEPDRGPRHDNDKTNYRRIQILPTHAEICCLEEPRLPYYPDSDSSVRTVVDFHFRLVREDMLAQLRRAIQWFLGGPGLTQFHELGTVQPPRHENIPKLVVYGNVTFNRVGCHTRKGVFFTVNATRPRKTSVLPTSSEASWRKSTAQTKLQEGNDRLPVGSLVALALGVSKAQTYPTIQPGDEYPRSMPLYAEDVFFGVVAARGYEEAKKVTTHLKFSKADAPQVLGRLRRQSEDTYAFLIEVSGVCFPPTEAILRTLQSYDVVLPPPLLEHIFTESSGEVFTRPPSQDGRGEETTWDLQHLVRDEAQETVDLRNVPVTDFEDLCDYLRPFEQQNQLKMDGSQVEAFAAAMTRACCLIQGPPGTGKSYVGVKIVETLLPKRRAVFADEEPPILCVCYTNHALDQFLEDLIKSEACELGHIVRIGGNSKSTMLQRRNLFELETRETYDEQHNYGRLFKKLKEYENERDVFSSANECTYDGFLAWFEENHWEEYRAITWYWCSSGDDEGFTTKDSRGSGPEQRWKSWLQGKNAPQLIAGINSPSPVDEGDLSDVLAECDGDIWRLSTKRRKQWAELWTGEWLDSSDKSITDAIDGYEALVQEMQELTEMRRLRVLRSAKVVGMTTTGCAQNQDLVQALAPKIVVCEEAGEVLEAHLLSCITPGIERLIQIGDHQQLRPPVNEYKLSAPARQGYNLDISLFERLVNDRIAFSGGDLDILRRAGALVTLQTQRRMRAEIVDIVRLTLYPTLEDAPVVREYPHVRGFRDNLWFFDHDHAETSEETSKANTFEAEMVVELVSYALKQGYAGHDIAVLTPYVGQLRVIRQLLGSKSVRVELGERDAEELARLNDVYRQNEEQKADAAVGSVSMQRIVRLSTVDNFQGDEATLVFISTVRCNSHGNSGFLKISNRMNVMLSRARHGMYILGSSRTIRQENKAKMFLNVLELLEQRQSVGDGEIVLTCQRHGHATHVTCASDIRSQTPDGGCLEPCQARLPCGHACPKMCHFDDPDHTLVRCLEPCDRQVESCGHFCRRLCSDECVCEKTRDCGHTETSITCPAWCELEKSPCSRLVQVKMPVCGHECSLPCTTARTIQETAAADGEGDISLAYLCNHVCGGPSEGCGHECTRTCGECLEASGEESELALQQLVALGKQKHTGDCGHVCDRAMPCGHYCRATCHPAGECSPCEQVCENKCSHSVCANKCSAVCASCSEPCDWHCPHTESTCPLPCGSPCIRLPCNERCGKMLPDCRHQCPGLCGEACLPSGYCRECGPSVARADDVVDVILHGTLSDSLPHQYICAPILSIFLAAIIY